jgi:CTP-dependent riboflavin kinase
MATACGVTILESQRDDTENQIQQLEQGRMKPYKVVAGGKDVDVTQEQIRVLRNQVTELTRAIALCRQP